MAASGAGACAPDFRAVRSPGRISCHGFPRNTNAMKPVLRFALTFVVFFAIYMPGWVASLFLPLGDLD